MEGYKCRVCGHNNFALRKEPILKCTRCGIEQKASKRLYRDYVRELGEFIKCSNPKTRRSKP